VTNVSFTKFFPVLVAAFADALSLTAAQTAPAPASTPAPSTPSPSAPAHATGQIGPGTTGTISPAQGVTPSTANKAGQILNGALTRKTRQTLQEAMNTVTPPPASDSVPADTNAPPAAAGH
jgi:Spy/CpxP family protein refolding chaperone